MPDGLVEVQEGTPAPPPPPANEGGAPPPPPPNEADIGERPTFIPEAAWDPEKGYDKNKHLEALRAETRPDSPDAYELPEIEGLDKEAAAQSPLMSALRKSAHAAGLDQEGFKAAVTDYVQESIRLGSEAAERERQALGANHEARTQAVGQWLGANLPRDQADAIAAGLTTAAAVIGFEKLMSSGTRKSGGDPPPQSGRKSREAIEALMATPAYMGDSRQRDPAVVKEVDDWWQEEGRLAQQKK